MEADDLYVDESKGRICITRGDQHLSFRPDAVKALRLFDRKNSVEAHFAIDGMLFDDPFCAKLSVPQAQEVVCAIDGDEPGWLG